MKKTPKKGDKNKGDKGAKKRSGIQKWIKLNGEYDVRVSTKRKDALVEAQRSSAEKMLHDLDAVLEEPTGPTYFAHTNAFSKQDLPEVRLGPYDDWISLPYIKVKPFKDTESAVPQVTICEPTKDDECKLSDHENICAGRSVSTYPTGMGEPICDFLQGELFERRTLLCLADGCSWGAKPREAARKATDAYMSYLKEQQCAIPDVREAGRLIFRAFSKAHEKIVDGYDDIWSAGTTTLCGGIFLELDTSDEETINKVRQLGEVLHVKDTTAEFTKQFKNDPRLNREGSSISDVEVKPRAEPSSAVHKWIFVCASVGDCKAYHYSPITNRFFDVTVGNRKNVSDAKDPGGRLGPYVGQGEPDLRNLGLYIMPCHPGDMVIIVSDGVHDNLDPQTLGIPPTDFGLDYETWEDAEREDIENATNAKTSFALDYMLHLCSAGGEEITASIVAQKLTDHALALTQSSRDFMLENPSTRLPDDYLKYPGKMDHTTAICGLAGGLTLLSKDGAVTLEPPAGSHYGSLAGLAVGKKPTSVSTTSSTHYGKLAPSTGDFSAIPEEAHYDPREITHLVCYDMNRTKLTVLEVDKNDTIIELIKKIRRQLHDIIEGRAFRLRKGDVGWTTKPPAIKKADFPRIAKDFFSTGDVIVVQFAPKEGLNVGSGASKRS